MSMLRLKHFDTHIESDSFNRKMLLITVKLDDALGILGSLGKFLVFFYNYVTHMISVFPFPSLTVVRVTDVGKHLL